MSNLFMSPQLSVIPRDLVVPQVSAALLLQTASILHESDGVGMTVNELSERLDRNPRTARYALVAAAAVGAASVRTLPFPRRLVGTTAYSQRNAFSVDNETVNGIKLYPFISVFNTLGAGAVERTLKSDYGLQGQTVSRRMRAIGSLSGFAADYIPSLIESPFQHFAPAVPAAPSTGRGRWADTGRPSARLASDEFFAPVVRSSDRRSAVNSSAMNVDLTFGTTRMSDLTSNVCPDCFMTRSANGACGC